MAVEFAEQVLEIKLYPWQRWLLIHALELHPGVTVKNMWDRPADTPIFRFRTIVVLVARQNGKTALAEVLSTFFLFILRTRLIIGTAQDLDTAEETWDAVQQMIDEIPELSEECLPPVMRNGAKAIRLKTGERYKVKASSRRTRGLSGDLVLLDELREHQTFEAWAALTNTTMARPNALIWCMSNAGDSSSVVLRSLRKKAHAALGDPDGFCAEDDPATLLPGVETVPEDDTAEDNPFSEAETLGLFEWSSPPGADPGDIRALAMANPALGHGYVTVRSLMGQRENSTRWDFMIENMCQWVTGAQSGPFPPGTWEASLWRPEEHPTYRSTVDPSQRQPQLVGKVKVCIEMSVDRSKAYIAVGGEGEDGRPQIELIAARAVTESVGYGWVLDWLQRNRDQYDEITCQKRGGPVAALVPELEALGLPYVAWQGPDLTGATGKFHDAVRDGKFRHFPQGLVDVPANTAVPKMLSGGAFVWDWHRSPVDPAPLNAFTGVWWLMNRPAPEPEPVSAYEAADLFFV